MPKVKTSIISITGKYGDDVFIDSGKHGRIMRKAPKAGSKRDEPVLKQQYTRTAQQNNK